MAGDVVHMNKKGRIPDEVYRGHELFVEQNQTTKQYVVSFVHCPVMPFTSRAIVSTDALAGARRRIDQLMGKK